MIVRLEELERCGIQRPKQPISLGVIYLDQPYYLEDAPWTSEVTATEHFRIRIERPHVPEERCLLVQSEQGYRLALQDPSVQAIPYPQALAHICDRMRVSGTLAIGTHRWGLRSYKNSFIGSDAVAWLAENLKISRPEAVALGQECINMNLFSHVLGEQAFADDYYYYRFSQDGSPEERSVTLT